jgi:hypothetical protein
MSNESKGMVKLASGWKWVDFGVAEKKLPDGRILRMVNREGYIERMPRGGDISWAQGWDCEVETADGETEKKWTLSSHSAWAASREAQVVWSHIPNGIHAVRAGATAQRVSVPVAE